MCEAHWARPLLSGHLNVIFNNFLVINYVYVLAT